MCVFASDKPDPPEDVGVSQCTSSYADIHWNAGNENNDEVIEFIVYYNTSHNRNEFVKATTVPKGRNTAKVGYFVVKCTFTK